MLNNEIFTSPEKCIVECDKQIGFSRNLITYLEQYIVQLETMKTMATSAQTLQKINPLNLMMQFMEQITPKNETEASKNPGKNSNEPEQK